MIEHGRSSQTPKREISREATPDWAKPRIPERTTRKRQQKTSQETAKTGKMKARSKFSSV